MIHAPHRCTTRRLWTLVCNIDRWAPTKRKSLSNGDAFQRRRECAKTAGNHLFHDTFTRAAVAPVPVRVVARLVETHSNVSSRPVDHLWDDVERSMKKTSTDRESSVAAPPFMSGDVMIIVLSIYPEHSESNQAATSVHKTMRACVCACSVERKINQELGVLFVSDCPSPCKAATSRPWSMDGIWIYDSEARITYRIAKQTSSSRQVTCTVVAPYP
jgi:hypothetical protein